MRNWRYLTLMAALSALLPSGPASAQVTIGVSGGPTFPAGDYGDQATVGWMGSAGFTVPIGESGFAVGASGFYGANGHEVVGDKTSLLGGLAAAGYVFETGGALMPYVFGGLGMLKRSYESDDNPDLEGSDSGLAYSGGLGAGFPLGGIQGMVGIVYVVGSGDVDGTELLGASFGVVFPLGGGT